jgi:hypothetical protein
MGKLRINGFMYVFLLQDFVAWAPAFFKQQTAVCAKIIFIFPASYNHLPAHVNDINRRQNAVTGA